MNKDTDVIAVAGATGKQGGAVARKLLARAYRVRAMTRAPQNEPARQLSALGAEVVQADLDDAASLERVLQDAWGVFAVQNTWDAGVEREEEQGKRLAELARRAGVRHFVYSSVGSAHRRTGIPHFDNKWRVEEAIRGLDFPSHVIIRPVFFMENLLSPWFKPGIDQGTLNMALQPDTSLQMIAVDDIGNYGALAFEEHEKLNRREIDIAGDQQTMVETAKTLSRVLGRTIAFQRVPIEEIRKFSEDYALMLEWFDRVGYDADITGNEAQYGIRPTSLTDWAAQVKWT
jgi:uncharacterized protein YbjT (DUF2867 family)